MVTTPQRASPGMPKRARGASRQPKCARQRACDAPGQSGARAAGVQMHRSASRVMGQAVAQCRQGYDGSKAGQWTIAVLCRAAKCEFSRGREGGRARSRSARMAQQNCVTVCGIHTADPCHGAPACLRPRDRPDCAHVEAGSARRRRKERMQVGVGALHEGAAAFGSVAIIKASACHSDCLSINVQLVAKACGAMCPAARKALAEGGGAYVGRRHDGHALSYGARAASREQCRSNQGAL